MINKCYIFDGIIFPMDNDFSIWLIREMDKRGWSQSDLSRASGLSRASISNMVAKKHTPATDTMIRVAKAFRYPIVDVLRAAGMLPKSTAKSENVDKLLFYFEQMDEKQQQALIDYADFILSR